MEIFFQIGDGMLIPLNDMETLRGAQKNLTNRTAAEALEGLGQERH